MSVNDIIQNFDASKYKPIDLDTLDLSVPDELTEEQKARLPEFRDKWLARGMLTGPIDFEAASYAVLKTYALAGLDLPRTIYHARNPFEAGLMGMLCHVMDRSLEDPSTVPQAEPKGEFRPVKFVQDKFEYVAAQVHEQRTNNGTWSDKAWEDTLKWLKFTPRDTVIDLLKTRHFGAMLYGCQEAHWLAIYDYLTEVCGKDYAKPYEGLLDLSQHVGWWSPYVGAVILQDRPIYIKVNEDHQLHCDGGPAIEYEGGLKGWQLNGLRVTQHVAETPGDELDPNELLPKEPNAQVRAEIIRKIGILRCLEQMNAKVVHEEEENGYCLYEVEFEGQPLRCLKMRNPSVEGLFHAEWVPDECKTVQDALNFRNSLTDDMIDDENGLEWTQQGDVIIRPSGEGLKFKSRPTQLT